MPANGPLASISSGPIVEPSPMSNLHVSSGRNLNAERGDLDHRLYSVTDSYETLARADTVSGASRNNQCCVACRRPSKAPH